MGNDNANTMVYEPFETVTLPSALPLCNTEGRLLYQVFKGTTGKTGTMTLGAVISPIPVSLGAV